MCYLSKDKTHPNRSSVLKDFYKTTNSLVYPVVAMEVSQPKTNVVPVWWGVCSRIPRVYEHAHIIKRIRASQPGVQGGSKQD